MSNNPVLILDTKTTDRGVLKFSHHMDGVSLVLINEDGKEIYIDDLFDGLTGRVIQVEIKSFKVSEPDKRNGQTFEEALGGSGHGK